MLWVLKRIVSMRRFFWAAKTYVKTDGLENIYNCTLKSVVYLNLCFNPKKGKPIFINNVRCYMVPFTHYSLHTSTTGKQGVKARIFLLVDLQNLLL